jgi:hypothetical protein
MVASLQLQHHCTCNMLAPQQCSAPAAALPALPRPVLTHSSSYSDSNALLLARLYPCPSSCVRCLWALHLSASLSAATGALQCLTAANAADQPRIMQCRLELQQCRKTPIIIWALGWLFLVGFSWVPCFYFCCCAKDPRCAAQGEMYTAQGVQVRVCNL